MITARTQLMTAAILTASALAFAGCGASDDERIRSAVSDLQQAMDDERFNRACELLTPRAEAQMTALVNSEGGCPKALSGGVRRRATVAT